MPVAFLGLGGLFVGAAWLLLIEYRRAFMADPASIMSLEVLTNILKLGGPGYLAMMALIAGVPPAVRRDSAVVHARMDGCTPAR